MRHRSLLVLILSLAACATQADPAPASEAPVTGLTPRDAPLEPIADEWEPAEDHAAEAIPAYDRDDWKHWVDADGDCQDARQEVLIAESEIAVTFESSKRCRVATGRWTCPFTGEVFTDPGKLDIDHLVPLAEAHNSGAWTWDANQREAYANDLNAPEHLVAVKASANRSKGAKDPAKWLPPLESARCQYVADWTAVKDRWGLRMDVSEAQAIEAVKATCADTSTPTPPEPANECCRVCRSGKACGDGCIAADKSCSKPSGCACDG